MSICKKHTKQLVAHAAVTHTYCIRSSQRKDKKYVTSVPAQPQDKFNFFFPSLLCLNFFAIACRHQNRWTEIAKTITYSDLTRTKDRRPAYNRVACPTMQNMQGEALTPLYPDFIGTGSPVLVYSGSLNIGLTFS